MQKRVLLEQAFVLRRIAYRDSSLLLTLLTKQYGRVALIAKGARRLNSKYRYLELFSPLRVSWVGGGELKTLTQAELENSYIQDYTLDYQAVVCGFYMNELVIKLIPPEDANEALWSIYQTTVQQLAKHVAPEVCLRIFEKRLLSLMGYGLLLSREANGFSPIVAQGCYEYVPEVGFSRCFLQVGHYFFSGASLLALEQEHFPDADSLKDAKRLLRLALGRLLPITSLKSRELLRLSDSNMLPEAL